MTAKTPKPRRRRAGALAALVAPAVLLAASLTSCSSKVGYAALVNGSVISQAELNQELADISANSQYVQLIDQPGGVGPVAGTSPGSYNKTFVAAVLDQEVRFEVVRQVLATNKALPSADQVNSAKSVVSNAFPSGVFSAFPARYQKLLATHQAEEDAFVGVVTKDLSGDSLNQYYQAHQGDYATEACVRHILIADKDQSGQLDYPTSLADAQRVKGLLDAGGDFAALAKQYSQDNQGTNGGSANQGGVLSGSAADGCLATSDLQQIVTPFATAVLQVPINQVTAPVQTQFGYHLIEVTKRVIEPLDKTVTADIHQRVAGQRLNAMVVKANVKVNPEFGSFSKAPTASGQISGVVAPIVPNLAPGTTAPASTAPASTAPTTSSAGG